MLYTNLSTIVKAVRLRYAVPFVLLLVAVYWMGIHPWMRNWGSTATAFLAVGIVVLGFLIFGRDWWGSLLVIGSIVMLTLLLAPDAYIAIGLAFALLLLAALGTMVTARTRTLGGATRRVAASTR